MTKPLAPRLHAKAWVEQHISRPIARVLLALHFSPTVITLLGLVVAGGAAALIGVDHLFLGGVVMLAGASLDLWDGALARLSGRVTKFGAFLDSITDRLSEAVVLLGLLVLYVRKDEDLGVYLVFVALVASLMVSYLRARAEGLGVSADIGILGRPERVVVLGAGLLVGYPLYALGLIAVVATLTVLQRVVHAAHALKDE